MTNQMLSEILYFLVVWYTFSLVGAGIASLTSIAIIGMLTNHKQEMLRIFLKNKKEE